nr:MAG TPA: hypothetical protein [Podoviridae sp. ct7dS1]
MLKRAEIYPNISRIFVHNAERAKIGSGTLGQ